MFFKISNFIPTECYKNVYQIDYANLFNGGKKLIMMDVDNTLIPYDQTEINEKIKVLFEEIESIGLKIILISNNSKNRIVTFLNGYNIPYVYKATKPLKRGFKKALKIYSEYSKDEVIVIGDQIITDVYGARRSALDVFLVKPIRKKSEKWYTKILRHFEKKALLKIKKHDSEMHRKIIEVIGDYS